MVISDRIARAFKAIRVLALDISKTFDKVWHAGLLHKLKACVHYFLWNFYFSPNDSPLKTISSKKLFLFLRYSNLSAIALQADPRKILKFMMSPTV